MQTSSPLWEGLGVRYFNLSNFIDKQLIIIFYWYSCTSLFVGFILYLWHINYNEKGLSAEALKKAKYAAKLYQNKNLKIDEIMKLAGIKSKATLYKYLKNQKML